MTHIGKLAVESWTGALACVGRTSDTPRSARRSRRAQLGVP